ncbi:hypothetical protein TSMEX_003787 [Taenia solium]|eukprot:TsM_000386300 transcript=TsM_000386300 gene=TsM_000386300
MTAVVFAGTVCFPTTMPSQVSFLLHNTYSF